jgi:hypothetical protein
MIIPPFCLLFRSHLSRVPLKSAPHRYIPLERGLSQLVFAILDVSHKTCNFYLSKDKKDHQLVHPCMHVKTTCKLTASNAQNVIIYHQIEKKNTSEWCAGMDMKEAGSANLQTNKLHLARQKTMPISGQDSNHIPPV